MDIRKTLEEVWHLKQRRRFDAALEETEKVLKVYPDHPRAIGQKAHILHLLGQTEAGLQYLSDHRARVHYPDYVEAVESELLWAAGRQDDARAVVDRLFARPDLSKAAVQRLVDQFRARSEMERARQLVARWVPLQDDRKEALLLQAEVELDPAPILSTLLRDYPDDPELFQKVARLRLNGLPVEQQVDELDVLLQTSRGADNLGLRKDLAMKLMGLGRYDEALRQFERCLLQSPRDMTVRAQLGYCLGKLKRYHEAVDALEECIRDYPRDMVMRRALFNYYQRSGQLPRARTLVETMQARYGKLAGPFWGELKKVGG